MFVEYCDTEVGNTCVFDSPRWHEYPFFTASEYSEVWLIAGAFVKGRFVSYLVMFPAPCRAVDKMTPPENWYMFTCCAIPLPSSSALLATTPWCVVSKHSSAIAAHVKNLSTEIHTCPRKGVCVHILFCTVTTQSGVVSVTLQLTAGCMGG